jgi:hypothetical protein
MFAIANYSHIVAEESTSGRQMESTSTRGLDQRSTIDSSCGRPGCVCSLPVGERFVLWAVRQWQADRSLPTVGSILHRGFKTAGLLEALPDFAIAMDALFFGARRGLQVHLPTCSAISGDEAMLIALCMLAQIDCDGPLAASLDVMMVPTASRVAGVRLKAFTGALASAGLRLVPAISDGAAAVH